MVHLRTSTSNPSERCARSPCKRNRHRSLLNLKLVPLRTRCIFSNAVWPSILNYVRILPSFSNMRSSNVLNRCHLSARISKLFARVIPTKNVDNKPEPVSVECFTASWFIFFSSLDRLNERAEDGDSGSILWFPSLFLSIFSCCIHSFSPGFLGLPLILLFACLKYYSHWNDKRWYIYILTYIWLRAICFFSLLYFIECQIKLFSVLLSKTSNLSHFLAVYWWNSFPLQMFSFSWTSVDEST